MEEQRGIPTARDLRAAGREALRGNWGKAFGMTLLLMILIGAYGLQWSLWGSMFTFRTEYIGGVYIQLPEFMGSPAVILLEIVLALAMWILQPAFQVGCMHFYTEINQRRESGAGALFSRLGCTGKILGANILIGLVYLLVMAVYMGVTLALLYFAPSATGAESMPVWVGAIITLLAIGAWVLMLLIGFRYAMVYYVFADNPETGVRECLRRSGEIMRGSKWRFFCLNLSFIGWALLTTAVSGIIAGILQYALPQIMWVAWLIMLPISVFLQIYINSACAAFYVERKTRGDIR